MRRLLAVFVLAISVVIVGPASPASALDWKDLTKVEKLSLYGPTVQTGKGLGKIALGATPPGRAWKILSAAALAWGAYEGADYLLNARQPGGSAADWLGEEAAFPTTLDDGTIVASVVSVSGRVATFEIGCKSWSHVSGDPPYDIWRCSTAVSHGGNFAIGKTTGQTHISESSCRNTTTNVVTLRQIPTMVLTHTNGIVGSGSAAGAPVTRTYTMCTTGEVVEGFRFGPASAPNPTSSTMFQTAPIGWGTMTGTTLPEGELTFEHAVIEAKCRNSETDEVQTIRTVSAWGDSETLVIPSCKQRLGDEWYGIGVTVIPMDPEIDDVPLDPEIWPDWDVPDFMPEEWTEGEVTPEEEADPCTGSKDGCPVTIEIDGEPVFPGSTTRTKIDTLRANDPDRVKCYIGQRQVEWKVCIPLLPGFEPGAGQSTTVDPTKPVPDTDVPPTTGTGTQPVPTEVGACMSAGFSWNPVSWVYIPVKCVLTWAFVPSSWPDWGSLPNPLPSGWVPTFPSLSGGSCGVVNMPSLNLGPLLSGTPSGKLFDSCEWAAARNVTYYGTLALMLVVVGTRGYRAVMNALGMAVEGSVV